VAKAKTKYCCQHCGATSPKWLGQCSDCGSWNSFVEEVLPAATPHARQAGFAGSNSEPTLLSQVVVSEHIRQTTGNDEFDHTLGGGLVPGSVVLIGGDPGIGKSTLLLQTMAAVSCREQALYITGEESLAQVAMRARRLHLALDQLTLLAETNVTRIIEVAQQVKPFVMVVDSIQTMFLESLTAAPGSVSQVREAAATLVQFAKQVGVAIFIVGHVTKEGAIAGPRVLEHMVDSVLYFEGQADNRYRVLRAVKNRFGAVNELGVFAMTDKGLKGVNNPSAIFLANMQRDVAGSAVLVTWEGSRPLLIEMQALLDEAHGGNPRRVCVGIDANRLSMLLAVLHRHAGVATYNQDVFINIVGGIKVMETAADLVILLAIYSSLNNRVLPADLVCFGEIGLGGEIRPVQSGQERLREAAKLGFKKAIIPAANAPKQRLGKLEIFAVQTVQEALEIVRNQ